MLGFDPRLQFVHEIDGLEAIRIATLGEMTGTFNVAGDGVILLSQAIRMTGHPYVAVPQKLSGLVGQLVRRAGLADFSAEQVRLLSFGRGLDTTAMRTRLGFEPRFTTREAFADFVSGRRLAGVFSPPAIAAAEQRLAALLSRLPGVGVTSS